MASDDEPGVARVAAILAAPPTPREGAQESCGFYELLPDMIDPGGGCGEVTLNAGFSPNNGIRVQLRDAESEDPHWRVFDFTDEQAETLGHALVRWAQRNRAQTDLIRCRMPGCQRTRR